MLPAFLPVIAPEIFALRPDYVAISVTADGLQTTATHPLADEYLAGTVAHRSPPWAEGHLEAWRTAYRGFGAKPQRTPCSVEALTARMLKDGHLPAVNAVVDLYNAISVRSAIPIGGENIAA